MPERQNDKAKKRIKRRRFLKAGAVAVGAAVIADKACSRDEVYSADYPVVPDNNVNLRPNGKSVLILGGGFGGMHAACELLDRGFDVTIIERSSTLGGKLKSWRDKDFGVPPEGDPNWKGYPRDHGAHAVWGFYNNLREFMGRHGYKLYRFPRESTMYNFLDKDGTHFTFGYRPTLPSIFGKIQAMKQMMAPLSVLTGDKSGKFQSDFLKIASFDFDNKRQRMYLDSVSFPEWARSVGIPEKVIQRFFGPISEMAMFDSIERTSALYILMLIALVSGHYEDLDIDIFMHPPGETYVAPIQQYIESKGGKILFDMPVVRLKKDGKKIKAAVAGDESPEAAMGMKRWKCGVCGNIFASPNKPHRCPFCGAQSSMINPFTAGPAKDFVADYYILAMDTPAAKEIVQKSDLLGDTYFDNIMKLDKCSVYPVNIWYSNCDSWVKRFPGHMDFFPSSFKYLGITLDWAFNGVINGKKVANPIVPDYQNKNIAVIETQIADAERVQDLSDEEIVQLVHEELKIAMPDLPNPTDFYVNRWDTYSPQRAGYEALRPDIQSPLDNLFLIGDWVKTNHLSVYMEKTNVSSKMVTNLILKKAGQRKGKIEVLQSGTPSMMIGMAKLFFHPYP